MVKIVCFRSCDFYHNKKNLKNIDYTPHIVHYILVPYYIPDSLCLLIPYSNIIPSPYTVFLMIAILVGIKWYQPVVLIYIPLMTNDTEHLLT